MAEFDSAVPPGGSGKIVARVDTSKFEGRRTKSVTVRSNDPVTPELTLRLSFDARPPIQVLPARLARLRAVQGRPAHQELILRRDDGEALEVTGISVTGDRVLAEIVDPGDPARSKDERAIAGGLAPRPRDKVLRLSVADPGEPGGWRAIVTLATDHPRQPEIRVPVHIQIRPLVQVAPQEIHLEAGPGGPHEVFVTLTHGSRRPFQLEEVRIEGALEGVSAEIVTPPGPIQRIRVRAAKGPADGEIVHGELVARTGLRKLEEIRVPIDLRRGAAESGAGSR